MEWLHAGGKLTKASKLKVWLAGFCPVCLWNRQQLFGENKYKAVLYYSINWIKILKNFLSSFQHENASLAEYIQFLIINIFWNLYFRNINIYICKGNVVRIIPNRMLYIKHKIFTPEPKLMLILCAYCTIFHIPYKFRAPDSTICIEIARNKIAGRVAHINDSVSSFSMPIAS